MLISIRNAAEYCNGNIVITRPGLHEANEQRQCKICWIFISTLYLDDQISMICIFLVLVRFIVQSYTLMYRANQANGKKWYFFSFLFCSIRFIEDEIEIELERKAREKERTDRANEIGWNWAMGQKNVQVNLMWMWCAVSLYTVRCIEPGFDAFCFDCVRDSFDVYFNPSLFCRLFNVPNKWDKIVCNSYALMLNTICQWFFKMENQSRKNVFIF